MTRSHPFDRHCFLEIETLCRKNSSSLNLIFKLLIKIVSVSRGPALSTFDLGGRDPDSLMSHSLIPIHTISSHASIAPPSTNQIRVRNKLDQSNANEEAWDEIVWIGIREWLIRESGYRPPKPNVLRAGPQVTDTVFTERKKSSKTVVLEWHYMYTKRGDAFIKFCFLGWHFWVVV